MYGPAFVAAIAYVDPGNLATNFAAGSQFGYLLVWVIVAGNLKALLVQMLSAKLGLTTGCDLLRTAAAGSPARLCSACGRRRNWSPSLQTSLRW
jgi:NRAMP (natural resistance-associated macrophage protein)-like metal ion transporter